MNLTDEGTEMEHRRRRRGACAYKHSTDDETMVNEDYPYEASRFTGFIGLDNGEGGGGYSPDHQGKTMKEGGKSCQHFKAFIVGID